MKMNRHDSGKQFGGALLWVLLACVVAGIAYFLFSKPKSPPPVIVMATPVPATPTPPPATPEPVVVKATPTPAPVVVAAPTPVPATPPPLDFATVARSPGLWPPQVALVQAVPFPLMFNGRVAGEVKAPVGTTLRLLRVVGDKVEVEYQAVRHVVPASATDLMARALIAFRKNGSEIPASGGMAAVAVPVVAAAAAPAPVAAGSSTSVKIGDRLIVDVSRMKRSRIEGGDFDDKRERIELKVKLTNTDNRIVADKLTTEVYVFGESILDRTAVKLLHLQTFDCKLEPRESHEEITEEVVTMYDTTGARFGHKYEGWVVRIKDGTGNVVTAKSTAASLLKGLEKAGGLAKDKTYDRATFKEKAEASMR